MIKGRCSKGSSLKRLWLHIGSIADGRTIGINSLCFDFDKPCPAVLLYFYRKFIVGFRCNSNSPFVFGFGRLPHHADDGVVVDEGVMRRLDGEIDRRLTLQMRVPHDAKPLADMQDVVEQESFPAGIH